MLVAACIAGISGVDTFGSRSRRSWRVTDEKSEHNRALPRFMLVAACIVVALKILWRQLTDYNKPVKLFITLDDQTLDRMLKKC